MTLSTYLASSRIVARLLRYLKAWRKPKPRRRADRLPCAECGLMVAHTKAGQAYLHRCAGTTLYPPAEGEP